MLKVVFIPILHAFTPPIAFISLVMPTQPLTQPLSAPIPRVVPLEYAFMPFIPHTCGLTQRIFAVALFAIAQASPGVPS